MKNFTLSGTLVATLALTGCQTTIPADDTTKPTVILSIQDGGDRAIGSTDPETELVLGCPDGTSASAQEIHRRYGAGPTEEYSYFYGAGTPPFKLSVTVIDSGGVQLARASFNDSTISRSNPEGSVEITDKGSARTYPHEETRSSGRTYTYRRVELEADRGDPLTALHMSFTANSLQTALISFYGEDFSGNSDSGIAFVLPATMCR